VVEKDQNRQGFPLEVLQEIHTLQEIHEKIYLALKTLCNDNLSAPAQNGKSRSPMLI
jgi:hypothetical protein